MQPRSDGTQRCLHFGLSTTPASRVMMYQDHDGNIVHHFNIPGRHVAAHASSPKRWSSALPVRRCRRRSAPAPGTDSTRATATGEFWELPQPEPVHALDRAARRTLAQEMRLERARRSARHAAPPERARSTTRFDYSPKSTRVDSPIDDALASRQGVCQDFAHIMIALARQLGIPCRYVSGYLFQQARAAPALGPTARPTPGSRRCCPSCGWVGFDPTNNLVAGDRHIRVAIGRDYADVPPTRGVFKGTSAVRSELAVSVRVGPAAANPAESLPPPMPWISRDVTQPPVRPDSISSQQQQQQQQQ